MQVNIFGGAVVNNGDVISITAGERLEFQITNVASNCSNLNIKNMYYTNYPTYDAYYYGYTKIKPTDCKGNNDYLNLIIYNNGTTCSSSSSTITIETNKGDFEFTLQVTGAPAISVSGGSPLASITNGSVITSDDNGTYFGVIESGNTITHNFVITNTGSCVLTIPTSAITSSIGNFTIGTPLNLPSYSPLTYPFDINPGGSVVVPITFSVGASTGTVTGTITILNNDTTFTFDVKAEVFNYTGPGPGGISADFRLWLRSNRGVVKDGSSKVSLWTDRGTNGKNATSVVGNEPTYYDDAAHNLNFNPVIKFENNGSTINQYLENDINGFYTQDIFVVIKPTTDVATSSAMTILSGTVSNYTNVDGSFSGNANYNNDGDAFTNDADPDSTPTDDITGLGFGNFDTSNTRLTGERLWYNQGSISSNPYYTIEGSNTETYASAGIVNVHNNAAITAQNMVYNGVDQTSIPTGNITFGNLGYDNSGTWFGTPYNIGKNIHDTNGNLNGYVAEIMTYATRVPDIDRPKIESYLAIKYGITLGVNGTSKDYYNSAGTKIWDITANSGFNYNIAGIGRDDNSDLDQKQSKSQNDPNDVTIYLGNIFATNNANSHDFGYNLNYLIWGCNNGNFSADPVTTSITLGTGYASTITKINREWKIVPTTGVGEDVGDVYVSILETALTTSFSKLASEEYALVVADDPSFAADKIIDIIPLKYNAVSGNLYTWYDFDQTLYFTFAKAPQVASKGALNLGTTDFLVGESGLDLDIYNFTVSAWIRTVNSSSNPRTIMAKGDKIQMRLNTSNQIEIIVDDTVNPVFTSTVTISDTKWHYISFAYSGGTVFLYVDGVLDKSVQNIPAPTPNFGHFSVGALYDDDVFTNTFNGEIDEITVFDYALTQAQVRYLMNQEIVKTSGGKVSGVVIPEATASNELSDKDWSKLKAYYDFNSFYGSTVQGLTDSRNFLRINYLNKGKSVVTPQTAPLPYVSNNDGEWDTAETWLNYSTQMPPNSVALDGTTSINWNIVEVSHNISSGDRDISVLGLVQTAGIITIADPLPALQDESNDGQGLFITHYLELDGVIDLVGESQLIQEVGSVLDEDSGGYIERDQQGTASSFNFNYWSSSVNTITPSGVGQRGTGIESTNTGDSVLEFLMDGSDSTTPKSISYNSSYTYADANYSGNKRISTYWLYKFNGLDTDYTAWTSINENTTILPGEGYTMKGTSGSEAITTNQNYVFKGKPNNGEIKLPILADEVRLVGNPYPSALDANEFILDNISVADGGTNTTGNIFNGALYFWDHFGQSGSHNSRDYEGGYATYTLMGGAKAYANDSRINATGERGTKRPERYIPLNQGFFVIAANDTLTNSLKTPIVISGGDIVFKNSQRVFEKERTTITNEGSVFFKTNKKTATAKNLDNDTRSKIRLKFNSPKGFHRQLLLGEDEKATNNFDLGYDALIADLGKEDMYWIVNETKYVIQAVNNFSEMEEFSLGLKIAKTGLVSIEIDDLENIDSNTDIFIKDAFLGTTNKINNQPFEINLDAGTYENRFSLTFAPKNTLAVSKETLEQEMQIFMNNANSELRINNTKQTEILSVKLFNSLGQLQNYWKNNLKDVTITLPVNNKVPGMYLVQIKTNIGLINKKIIVE
ncbi:LamG-like jellyroll fold domain-containing protein [Lutibacter sp. HS1-25]|uniref:LamG-like jellyroll fold domain-containing protein n=1 Tax=Lutibacter sp. HS1-25 TaxID=2485000 RepID=UPI0013E92618|nr:LamG-like jellyroll fold domain-containing protein [Lutibacter sp. HS1-25]